MDKVLGSTRSWFNKSLQSIRAVAPYSYRMIRKPTVMGYWLSTAKAGLLLLVLMLVLFPTFMPRALDSVLPLMYQPVVEEKLFGLIKQEKENPLLPIRREQAIVALWMVGGFAVLVLLWMHIPKAVRRATERSRDHEREADELLVSDPSQSLLLYRSAMSWATDAEHEAELQSKVDSLNHRLSRYLQRDQQGHELENEASDDDVEQTVRLPELAVVEQSPQRDVPQQRYRVEEQLGSGGMGAVHRGTDTVLDRQVAIKILKAHLANDNELMSRFEQEARALARLSHQGIVQVYDFVRSNQQVSIVMELVDGFDLQQHVAAASGFAISDALHIALQLAEGVSYAHEQQVVHRDFKPANVLMTREGQAKITDFGLAKVADGGFETMAGTIIGSPAYMSPEQALGQPLDARTDIYSFGVVLYWMVVGKLPFEGNARDLMYAHVNEAATPPEKVNKRIDENLGALIMRLLQKNPDDRIASMQEVAQRLRALGG